ncbi:hypothetical protein [Acinetobacter sp.]|uniref:hypothetical protein n=1 Tax=Acinetobacter sp. TaxID=472 RepID=UPI0028A6126D|nr:hypothetical protein [Acinetobacter sp.]
MNELFFYSIDPFKLDMIFDSAIRHKIDLMKLSLNLIIELINEEVGFILNEKSNFVLIKSKNTFRYSVIKENQIMSAILPFRFNFDEDIEFNYNMEVIDLNDFYILLSCVDKIKYEIDNGMDLLSDDIRSLIDEVLIQDLNLNNALEYKYKKLLNHMFFQEDGYLRFDYDEENCNGYLHPLNHLDVNYSNSSTFKLGIKSKINFHTFWDILRSDTNCFYLEQT